jgi:hypothetical protein
MTALGQATGFSALRALDLTKNPTKPSLGRALAGASWLASLEELNLTTTDLDAAGLEALFALELPALRSLTLFLNNLYVAGARVIARHSPPLRALNLASTRLGGAGLRALAESSRLETVKSFNFAFNGPIEPEELARLVDSPLFTGLEELSLSDCRIGDEGARILAAAPALSTLTSLRLNPDPCYLSFRPDRSLHIRLPKGLEREMGVKLARRRAQPNPRGFSVNERAELCSGENVARCLRSQDVVDPPVEERRVIAGPNALGFVLGERDPSAREQP